MYLKLFLKKFNLEKYIYTIILKNNYIYIYMLYFFNGREGEGVRGKGHYYPALIPRL